MIRSEHRERRGEFATGLLPRLLLVLVLCGAGASATAGQLVVAGSNDPRHRVGAIIDGAAPLRVASGKAVTLIAQDGRKIRIEGPYAAAPDARTAATDDSMLTTLSRMLSGSRATSTMAVFRAAPRTTVHSVVALDSSGLRCVSTDTPIRFSRRDPSPAGTLTLAQIDGPSVHGPWPSREREIAWPEELPVRAGTRYSATLSGGEQSSEVQLFTLPAGLPSQAHAIAWMAERGCERDARRALRRLLR